MEPTMNHDDLQNKDYRDAFVDAMIRTGIAFQIKALRKREDMSQKELGELVVTPQNVISRYENPDYSGFTLKTLQRLASAFDVALIVKFATFRELRKLTEDRSPDNLSVPSFPHESDSYEAPETLQTASTINELDSQVTSLSKKCDVVSLVDHMNKQTSVVSSGVHGFKSESTHQDRYSNASP